MRKIIIRLLDSPPAAGDMWYFAADVEGKSTEFTSWKRLPNEKNDDLANERFDEGCIELGNRITAILCGDTV